MPTHWTDQELAQIGQAEELEIASLRLDSTLSKPTTIWVVRDGDDLYVRAYEGRISPWFKRVQERHKGHIRAGGIDKDVRFVEESDPALLARIDDLYRTKYRRYAADIVNSMLTTKARAATIKLVPGS